MLGQYLHITANLADLKSNLDPPRITIRRKFISIPLIADVEVTQTGIVAHASLVVGERFHNQLRPIFRKIKGFRQGVNKEFALELSVKAMNDTLGLEILVPSALVFGEFPYIGARSKFRQERSTLRERAECIALARREMLHKMA